MTLISVFQAWHRFVADYCGFMLASTVAHRKKCIEAEKEHRGQVDQKVGPLPITSGTCTKRKAIAQSPYQLSRGGGLQSNASLVSDWQRIKGTRSHDWHGWRCCRVSKRATRVWQALVSRRSPWIAGLR